MKSMQHTGGAWWEGWIQYIKYTTGFLYSNWLYILWHGINVYIIFFHAGKIETCRKKIDLAIILDASGSVDEGTFNLAKDFAKTLLSRFTISPDNSRVSIVSYSRNIDVKSRFSDDQDERKLEDILNNTFYEALTSATGKTLQVVRFEVFSTESGSRIGNPGKQFIEQKFKKPLPNNLVLKDNVLFSWEAWWPPG